MKGEMGLAGIMLGVGVANEVAPLCAPVTSP
jgi:hypothetical protein